jgi:4-carboxymuconolactone decarboxylase
MIHDQQFDLGLQLRRDMFGVVGADDQVSSTDEWDDKLQEIVTRHVFGDVWQRPGLDRRTRSLVTLAMLVATNRSHEVGIHLRGALSNGVTGEELRELMLHASIYCGLPAAVDGIRAARAVVEERAAVGGQA